MPRIHIQALKLSFKGRGLKCIDWAKTGGVVSGSVARKQVTFFFLFTKLKGVVVGRRLPYLPVYKSRFFSHIFVGASYPPVRLMYGINLVRGGRAWSALEKVRVCCAMSVDVKRYSSWSK